MEDVDPLGREEMFGSVETTMSKVCLRLRSPSTLTVSGWMGPTPIGLGVLSMGWWYGKCNIGSLLIVGRLSGDLWGWYKAVNYHYYDSFDPIIRRIPGFRV